MIFLNIVYLTFLEQVQLQEAFTGIRFDDVISRVLEQTPERTVRVQTIDGACSDLEFKVKFEVIETEVRVYFQLRKVIGI